MAIDRTAFNALVDDTGVGNGSIWDKSAIQTVLLDPIDAAIVAGGGTAAIQTTTSTGTVNNFGATVARRLVLRCNNASLLTLTGIQFSGSDGDVIDVVSVGAGQVDLAHQDAGSTAGYRLINFATSGKTSLAAGSGTARYVYDGTTSRWRLLIHDQGAWITPAYAAGDFTGGGSMTWTVDSGDVSAYAYWLKGRTLIVRWKLGTTSIGGTLNTIVQIKIPGGFSGVTSTTSGHMYGQGGVFANLSGAIVDTGAPTQIQLYTANFGAANYAASTNTSSFYGSIPIEVS